MQRGAPFVTPPMAKPMLQNWTVMFTLKERPGSE